MKSAPVSQKSSDYNEEAYKERQRNRQYIHSYRGPHMGDCDMKVLEVDCKHATYKGEKIKNLGSFHRRKFENLLVISEMPQPIEVRYY